METTNPNLMPIALVKETSGSVLLKVHLKPCLPDIIYFKSAVSTFQMKEEESKTFLNMKAASPTQIDQEEVIVLDLAVRQ
jgi:hypothetical protein